ncbi:MAG: hypothetical protein BAJATHORv1_30513 [Candidatus Thorarchaeota archaeon]|nr:MAG: hypothetical protein BAJATHORv1_30513 [Candidatus Thorarchaeota archaeon]
MPFCFDTSSIEAERFVLEILITSLTKTSLEDIIRRTQELLSTLLLV